MYGPRFSLHPSCVCCVCDPVANTAIKKKVSPPFSDNTNFELRWKGLFLKCRERWRFNESKIFTRMQITAERLGNEDRTHTVCLSVCQSICLFVCLSFLFICPSVLFVHLSVGHSCSSVHQSCLSVCPVHLSVRPVHQSVSLSVPKLVW